MVQSAFHHSFRGGCAVAGQNVLFQTAAVDADADRDILLLAGIHHRLYPVVIADVARVDTDLIYAYVRAGQRSLIVKVDICTMGMFTAFLTASMHFASAGLGQVTRKI